MKDVVWGLFKENPDWLPPVLLALSSDPGKFADFLEQYFVGKCILVCDLHEDDNSWEDIKWELKWVEIDPETKLSFECQRQGDSFLFNVIHLEDETYREHSVAKFRLKQVSLL